MDREQQIPLSALALMTACASFALRGEPSPEV